MHHTNQISPDVHRGGLQRGFTLIELLVVIAVIVALAAVMVPALAKAQRRSTLDVCLNNQKQFGLAWVMFSGDHADYVVSARQDWSTNDSLFSWRIEPASLHGAPTTVPSGQTAQIFYDSYGFQTGGLYPYIDDSTVIHCPADSRYLKSQPAWCSYSMVDNMNGATAPATGVDYRIHKSSQVRMPSARMILSEENDPRSEIAPNGGTVYENLATWEPYHPGSGSGGDAPAPQSFTSMKAGGIAGWYDGPTVFHATGGTFSFCDGHAEFHKWQDSTTLLFALSPSTARSSGVASGSASLGRDTFWVYSHIASPFWP